MAQPPHNVVSLAPNPVPRDFSSSQLWAQRHLRRHLHTVRHTMRGPAPNYPGTLTAVLDILAIIAAYLAQTHPEDAAAALEDRLDANACDLDATSTIEASAMSITWALEPVLTRTAQSLQSKALQRAQALLVGVLRDGLAAFIAVDLDLHQLLLQLLCEQLHAALDARRASDALQILQDLSAWILPSASAVLAASSEPVRPHTEVDADMASLVIEIEQGILIPLASLDTSIARLEARQGALDPDAPDSALFADLIENRLCELRAKRASLVSVNRSIGRPRVLT